MIQNSQDYRHKSDAINVVKLHAINVVCCGGGNVQIPIYKVSVLPIWKAKSNVSSTGTRFFLHSKVGSSG